jgi:two-component system, sensor histidine kinase YesM
VFIMKHAMDFRLPALLGSGKKSIKHRLTIAFCLLSILPMIVALLVSYYSLAGILQRKVDALERTNLLQTRKILGTKLEFYQDLLYQLYADDHLIDLMKRLDEGENVAFTSGQMRRALRTYSYAMPYVQSLAVLTASGRMVFDDLLTGYNTKSSWLDASGGRAEALYRAAAEAPGTVFFPTERASLYEGKPHYLFHLAHRFVETRDIWAKRGIIILSIDERMLGEICDEDSVAGSSGPAEGAIFILAPDGTVVSHPRDGLLGTSLALPSAPGPRAEAVGRTIWDPPGAAAGGARGREAAKPKPSIYEIVEPKTGWTIIAAQDQSLTYREIAALQRNTIAVVLAAIAVLLSTIFYITGRLTKSIDSVSKAMNAAADGELSIRIPIGEEMPLEVEKIANSFNFMIGRIDRLLREVQSALTKQRDAEIAALEAQVNPHFLYNTLDTINWMAIDREEFEISDAIAALAAILRYAIDDSNGVVEVSRELEWLDSYVALQRIRLKRDLEFIVDVEAPALDLRIHKLLFQPFVENAIVHGFREDGRGHRLSFSMHVESESLLVEISDNGGGMDPAILTKGEVADPPEPRRRGHIGVRNAIERIRMYYGPGSSVAIESSPGAGTSIHIGIPLAALGKDRA